MSFIIRNYRLGWWKLGAKLFVFQEVQETLLYLLAPFVLPISFYVRPPFLGFLYVATLALYQLNVIIFDCVSREIYRIHPISSIIEICWFIMSAQA